MTVALLPMPDELENAERRAPSVLIEYRLLQVEKGLAELRAEVAAASERTTDFWRSSVIGPSVVAGIGVALTWLVSHK